MKLYDYFRSSAAYRVRIALNLKGIEAERVFVHLRRKDHRAADYLAVNPQGLVPTLVDDDGTTVTQSLAIIEYLDETRPAWPLLPADAAGRARVRAIAQAIACEIHPLNNLRVLRHIDQTFGTDEETRTRVWYRHWIAEGMAGVEGMLASQPVTGAPATGQPATGRFCHGDTPTLADCTLVPQVFNATRFGADMTPYPTVMRIFEACAALDAFDRAQPDKQPDAEA